MALQSVSFGPQTPSSVTITIASPGVVTWAAHSLLPGQAVVLTTTGALPTGLTALTTYFVISAGFTSSTFQLSATSGGSAINTSGTQSGAHTAQSVLNSLSSGQKAAADSTSVVLASDQLGAQITVTPTVTAGAYTAGQPLGGVLTFANALPGSLVGMLQSITLRFKATTQVVSFNFTMFSATLAGTYADHANITYNSGDMALMMGSWTLSIPANPLGTNTIYNLDGIGKQLVGSSTSLFGIVTPVTAPVNPASTSEMSVVLGMLWS